MPQPPTFATSLAHWVATLALTGLLTAGLGELGLRLVLAKVQVYDIEMTRYALEAKQESPSPAIGHVHKAGARATLMGVPVAINAAGMRDDEVAHERGAARRLAFLGDSLTFGWGVAKEQTFADRLERRLSAAAPTEVLNFGTGNYNTSQEVAHFVEHGLAFRPDTVVVFYFINDAEPTPQRSPYAALARSRLASFVWSRVLALRARLAPDAAGYREQYRRLYDDAQPGWIAAQAAFRSLRDACAERGMGLKVVLLPELHAPADYPFAREHAKVMALLAELRIDAMDLAPAFAGVRDPMRLWVAPDDAHPNAEAHAMIADAVYPFLAATEVARRP